MIFDEITLHNFGAYSGKHTITLTPKSKKKPIILIGGYNGAGKTTLFNAFHLALFGKLSNNTGKQDKPYEQYLKESINKYVPQREGAKISLKFRHQTDDGENRYEVHRSWYSNGSGVREQVEVFLNGQFDPVVSESWSEIVEEFIPIEIAKLFFFDGEKIKEFAESKKTSQVIYTGINALLGLHLIDKLYADLNVLKKRKAKAFQDTAAHEKINELQSEINQMDKQRSMRKIKKHAVEKEIESLEKDLKKQENKFKKAGGEIYNSRHQLKEEKSIIESRINTLHSQMIELAASALPLSRVRSLLSDIESQDKKEQETIKSKLLLDQLKSRDEDLLEYIKQTNPSDKQLSDIKKYLSKDRQKLKKESQGPVYHNLSEETRESLSNLQNSILPGLLSKTKETTAEYNELNSKLLNLNRKLEMVPEEESIIEYITRIEKIKVALEKKHSELATVKEQYQHSCNNHEALKNQLTKEIEKNISQELEYESERRVMDYSQKAQSTIKEYKSIIIQKHLDSIQDLIMQSIKKLFSKKNFIKSFVINPETFTFELRDKKGEPINLEGLSAGEKQLLVTSILWGIAKASTFPLPAIIDTPLGRLDSNHRKNIVERYFPLASHQVMLLSTDEEISKEYLDKIKPYVSHSYLLGHDTKKETTIIQKGYFQGVS